MYQSKREMIVCRVKEALDFIARTIATYLYLKNVRRDLQLGKTILHQVVPETVGFLNNFHLPFCEGVA